LLFTKQCGKQIREPEMCSAFIIRERMTVTHRISFEHLKGKKLHRRPRPDMGRKFEIVSHLNRQGVHYLKVKSWLGEGETSLNGFL